MCQDLDFLFFFWLDAAQSSVGNGYSGTHGQQHSKWVWVAWLPFSQQSTMPRGRVLKNQLSQVIPGVWQAPKIIVAQCTVYTLFRCRLFQNFPPLLPNAPSRSIMVRPLLAAVHNALCCTTCNKFHIQLMQQLNVVVSSPAFLQNTYLTNVTFDPEPYDLWP